MPFSKKIKFNLYNVNNQLIENTNWEYSEQQDIGEYLRPTDNVLQLGGNIGASCIYVDRLINTGNLNICVEPYHKIISTLEKNRKLTDANFQIINGVISDSTDLKLDVNKNESNNNFWGSSISNNGNVNITSYPLKTIKYYDKINVLFADCEGCLEKFIDEYEWFLNQLRLILYEEDQPHKCDYSKIAKILVNNNFKEIKSGFHKVWIK